MKILIEGKGRSSIVIDDGDDKQFHEVVELFKSAAIGYGFHPDTVREYFNELEEEDGESTSDDDDRT